MIATYKWLVTFFISILIVIFVFFYSTQLPNFMNFSKISELKLNEFGDFVGGTLNPILSFFGFMALLYTISIQRKQIAEDKKDREKQQFESTFFALLNLHNKTLDDFFESKNIKIELEDGTKTNFFDRDLKDMLRDNNNLLKEIKPYFHTGNEMYGHYFRIFYQLLKFIFTEASGEKTNKKNALNFKNDIRLADKNNEKASDIEKRYSNIIRALLPDDVMKFLTVNCYCEDENDIYWEYKLLLERYDFFEHASFNPNNPANKSVVEQYPVLKEAQEFYKKAFGL